jgi:hypothetical protein
MRRAFWDLYMLLSMYSEFTFLCGSVLLLNQICFKLHSISIGVFAVIRRMGRTFVLSLLPSSFIASPPPLHL